MNYRSAINEQQEASGTEYHTFTYTHPSGAETVYDLQEIRQDNGAVAYVVSESPYNQGPGFESQGIRDVIAHQAAQSALALNDPEINPNVEDKMRAHELTLYQQRPDGNFERVDFYEIRQDGRSAVELEREQADPDLFPSSTRDQESAQARTPDITELHRSPTYTRQEVEERVDAPLRAPEETHQQAQAAQPEAWRDMSGPAIDRGAEVAADQASQAQQAQQAAQAAQDAQQRSQEQATQMNHHQQDHSHSQQF